MERRAVPAGTESVWPWVEQQQHNTMYDLIIIGSGPAGMSAAVYGVRAGLHLLVLEEKPMSGGQILNTYEVDNYLGMPGINGFDMGMKFREHMDSMGVECRTATVTGITDRGQSKVVETADGTGYEARTLILATGAEHASLDAPGEEAYKGRGVSYCATCDGAFFRGKMTAVVGGGDVAVEDAIFLARSCEKVYLIHRRDELRAADILQKELKALPNIEILWNTVVKEISGEEKAQSLTLEDTRTGVRRSLAADGVFIAVGIVPSGDLMKDMVDHDEQGYFLAGEECATSVPGIFVAGDVV